MKYVIGAENWLYKDFEVADKQPNRRYYRYKTEGLNDQFQNTWFFL